MAEKIVKRGTRFTTIRGKRYKRVSRWDTKISKIPKPRNKGCKVVKWDRKKGKFKDNFAYFCKKS